jgi:hypothetical protein
MPSYRGEVPARHPRFPEGSAAACGEACGPVDLNAPDIVYTAEDDAAIEQYCRHNSKSRLQSLQRDTELNLSAHNVAFSMCNLHTFMSGG